jgi:hypothetical protein
MPDSSPFVVYSKHTDADQSFVLELFRDGRVWEWVDDRAAGWAGMWSAAPDPSDPNAFRTTIGPWKNLYVQGRSVQQPSGAITTIQLRTAEAGAPVSGGQTSTATTLPAMPSTPGDPAEFDEQVAKLTESLRATPNSQLKGLKDLADKRPVELVKKALDDPQAYEGQVSEAVQFALIERDGIVAKAGLTPPSTAEGRIMLLDAINRAAIEAQVLSKAVETRYLEEDVKYARFEVQRAASRLELRVLEATAGDVVATESARANAGRIAAETQREAAVKVAPHTVATASAKAEQERLATEGRLRALQAEQFIAEINTRVNALPHQAKQDALPEWSRLQHERELMKLKDAEFKNKTLRFWRRLGIRLKIDDL